MTNNNYNYTAFYIARKESKLDRFELSRLTGLSEKRITNLEKGIGGYPTIEEIMLLEEIYKSNTLKNYYIELLNQGGLCQPMCKKVKESTPLEKFIALKQPIMYIPQIATALSCSTATAIKIKKDLVDFAIKVKGLAIPPNDGIQTLIFVERYGISYRDFENDFEVIMYLRSKEHR